MSSRIESLSAAVVGTGFIGPVHVEGLRRAGVQVAGIVGSSPEKSKAAAERLGLPRGYESFQKRYGATLWPCTHISFGGVYRDHLPNSD